MTNEQQMILAKSWLLHLLCTNMAQSSVSTPLGLGVFERALDEALAKFGVNEQNLGLVFENLFREAERHQEHHPVLYYSQWGALGPIAGRNTTPDEDFYVVDKTGRNWILKTPASFSGMLPLSTPYSFPGAQFDDTLPGSNTTPDDD